MRETNQRLLLIDTCGDNAGVALSVGGRIVTAQNLAPGRASAEIVGTVRLLLEQAGWQLSGLDAVGVVSGPGSFTGVRTGLAAAKGLCEAAALPLIAVSRLTVLADAAGIVDGIVALDAGRGELYLRNARSGSEAKESLCKLEDLDPILQGRPLVVAEARLLERLTALPLGMKPRLFPLHVTDALPLVLSALHTSAPDAAALAEANYVRQEQDIYPRAAGK